jgi:hypothetical protein
VIAKRRLDRGDEVIALLQDRDTHGARAQAPVGASSTGGTGALASMRITV